MVVGGGGGGGHWWAAAHPLNVYIGVCGLISTRLLMHLSDAATRRMLLRVEDPRSTANRVLGTDPGKPSAIAVGKQILYWMRSISDVGVDSGWMSGSELTLRARAREGCPSGTRSASASLACGALRERTCKFCVKIRFWHGQACPG